MSAAIKEVAEQTATPEAVRLQRLEHLLDVMVAALGRITARAADAGNDLGQGVMVRGAIAHGVLQTVRGIAEEALEVACAEVER